METEEHPAMSAVQRTAWRRRQLTGEKLSEDLLHQGHHKAPQLPLLLRQLPQAHELPHLGAHIWSLGQRLEQLLTVRGSSFGGSGSWTLELFLLPGPDSQATSSQAVLGL